MLLRLSHDTYCLPATCTPIIIIQIGASSISTFVLVCPTTSPLVSHPVDIVVAEGLNGWSGDLIGEGGINACTTFRRGLWRELSAACGGGTSILEESWQVSIWALRRGYWEITEGWGTPIPVKIKGSSAPPFPPCRGLEPCLSNLDRLCSGLLLPVSLRRFRLDFSSTSGIVVIAPIGIKSAYLFRLCLLGARSFETLSCSRPSLLFAPRAGFILLSATLGFSNSASAGGTCSNLPFSFVRDVVLLSDNKVSFPSFRRGLLGYRSFITLLSPSRLNLYFVPRPASELGPAALNFFNSALIKGICSRIHCSNNF